MGFPGGSVAKNLPAMARDVGSIPGSEDPLEKEMAIDTGNFSEYKTDQNYPSKIQPPTIMGL